MVERNCVTRGQGLCLVSEKCPAISSYTCDKKDCLSERERVSTWCTSFVSSCAAFSASLSKKSELAFGDGAILNIIFRVFS